MKPFHLIFLLTLNLCISSLSANTDTLGLELQWEKQTFPALPQSLVVDEQNRPYLYLAAKSGGLRIWEDHGNELPDEINTITPDQLEDLEVMHLSQEGNLLFLALGNFFGSTQQHAGLGIVDISDPVNPQVMDVWKVDTLVKGSAIVIVEGDYAYLGAMNMGLIVLDISNPQAIQWLTTYQPDINFPEENPGDVQYPNARGMDIRDNLLYLCYDAGGIRVIDISNPAQPSEYGRYINEAVLGKQQAYNNILLNGNLAYVAVDYCGLEILDISQPDSIYQVGWWNPWNCENPFNLWINSAGHVNQLAYDAVHQQVFLSSGGSELSIVDVSQPDQPGLCSSYGTSGNQLGTWGVTLDEDRLFLTYINTIIPFIGTWSGVKMLALDQMSTATEEVVFQEPLQQFRVSPNPFQESVQLDFALLRPQSTTLSIYNATGKIVWHQSRALLSPGAHQFHWNGNDHKGRKVPPGVYYFVVQLEEREYLQKLIRI